MTLLEERVMEIVFYLGREPMNHRPISVMNNSNLFMIFDKTYINFYLLSPSSRFNLNRLIFHSITTDGCGLILKNQYNINGRFWSGENVSRYLKNQ